MPNLNVAVIGPEGYAKDLGKLGTTSDITFYNQKKDEVTVTLVEATRYPEKLSSLFYAVSLADTVILVVDEIGSALGECILLLDCASKDRGLIVLRNFISPEQIAPLIRGTVVAGYEIVPDDPRLLRERLVSEASAVRPVSSTTGATSSGAVPVDHFFAVKGIGTVALGVVAQGVVKRHDILRVYPTTKQALVRSMQKHDDDAESAYAGERVGLALKGVEIDDLDRGYVLSNNPALISSSTLTGRAELIPYWPNPIREGMVLYIGHWMQFIPARVAFVDNAGDWKRPELTLRTEKDLVYLPEATGILHYLEGGKLRIVGKIGLS
ncbi:MAG: elongation factor Tu [Methanoregulaceae archaeon]|nr:elongation factor Tu [Methanoregulaceae archaeon]